MKEQNEGAEREPAEPVYGRGPAGAASAKGDIDDFIFSGEYEYIKTVSER